MSKTLGVLSETHEARARGCCPVSNTQEETRVTRAAAPIARFIARLRDLGYAAVPESRGKRDLRIDLLRGFCVFVMIVDHVGGESSWLYLVTGGNRFFVSAAEGFWFPLAHRTGVCAH